MAEDTPSPQRLGGPVTYGPADLTFMLFLKCRDRDAAERLFSHLVNYGFKFNPNRGEMGVEEAGLLLSGSERLSYVVRVRQRGGYQPSLDELREALAAWTDVPEDLPDLLPVHPEGERIPVFEVPEA